MDKEILEGNRLIAEFVAKRIDSFPDKSSTWIVGETGSEIWHNVDSGYWEFHSSWGWIMHVVEKIENLKNGNSYLYSFNMGRDFCTIETNDLYMKTITTASVSGSKIMSVWQAVVQFIKWYNINSTTKQEEK